MARSIQHQAVKTATPAEQSFLDAFDATQGDLPGTDVPWLVERRRAAAARFAGTGLPHRRVEAWKYTDLRARLKTAFRVAEPVTAWDTAVLAGDPLADEAALTIRIVNGVVDALPGDLPDGVTIHSLHSALANEPNRLGRLFPETDGSARIVDDLTTALCQDGLIIDIAEGVTLGRPVHLQFITPEGQEGSARHMRLAVRLGARAKVTLTESHLGGAEDTLGALTALAEVGEGGVLTHIKAAAEGDRAVNLAAFYATLADHAVYDGFVYARGGALTRHEAEVICAGPYAHARINGAYLLTGRQHFDLTTLVDHAVPHTTSQEAVKGVLGGQARGVFQGKFIVRQDAQHTDAHQLGKALLLSPKAEADFKPELEIWADDVKCGHGATVGEVDADALFYLRSRGVPEAEAKALLIEAFLQDVLGQITLEAARGRLQADASQWLAAHAGAAPAEREEDETL